MIRLFQKSVTDDRAEWSLLWCGVPVAEVVCNDEGPRVTYDSTFTREQRDEFFEEVRSLLTRYFGEGYRISQPDAWNFGSVAVDRILSVLAVEEEFSDDFPEIYYQSQAGRLTYEVVDQWSHRNIVDLYREMTGRTLTVSPTLAHIVTMAELRKQLWRNRKIRAKLRRARGIKRTTPEGITAKEIDYPALEKRRVPNQDSIAGRVWDLLNTGEATFEDVTECAFCRPYDFNSNGVEYDELSSYKKTLSWIRDMSRVYGFGIEESTAGYLRLSF